MTQQGAHRLAPICSQGCLRPEADGKPIGRRRRNVAGILIWYDARRSGRECAPRAMSSRPLGSRVVIALKLHPQVEGRCVKAFADQGYAVQRLVVECHPGIAAFFDLVTHPMDCGAGSPKCRRTSFSGW